jgi:hypothetical protein
MPLERSAQWSPPVSRSDGVRLSTRQAKANAEAIFASGRIDFDLKRLRELIESIEKGPQRRLRDREGAHRPADARAASTRCPSHERSTASI